MLRGWGLLSARDANGRRLPRRRARGWRVGARRLLGLGLKVLLLRLVLLRLGLGLSLLLLRLKLLLLLLLRG